jgi:hypothetical protein
MITRLISFFIWYSAVMTDRLTDVFERFYLMRLFLQKFPCGGCIMYTLELVIKMDLTVLIYCISSIFICINAAITEQR